MSTIVPTGRPSLPSYLSWYDPSWPGQYLLLAARLRGAIGECRIEHVGSTSVPDMVAKPIVDLVIVLDDELTPLIGPLESLGYRHTGDQGLPGREAFRYVGSETLPEHHLYASAADGEEFRKHLLFRDYLRQHPQRAAWLSEQKVLLALGRARSRSDYIAAKDPCYRTVLAEAEAWRAKMPH
jgi:GrpB-like predicted nucleotidyltransferase (UPF0157 family)